MDVFTGVVGHEKVRQHLSAALVNHTVSHAYLFEGIDGVGKTTMALELIRALLCTQPQANHMACGHCLSCRTLLTGNHPDFIRITRGEKASLGIGEIRDRLVYDAAVRPYQSAWKVYLIEEADTMTPEAQNALLKTLEEPPEYVLIILLANNSQQFLPTILSRVITLHFQPLEQQLIAQELMRREGVPKERADVIAALCRGSLGEALELATSESFAAMREELAGLLEGLHSKKPSEILQMADFFNRYKDSQDMVFSLLVIWFRDLMVLKLEQGEEAVLTRDRIEVLRKLAMEYDTDEVMRLFSSVERTRDAIRLGAQYAFAIDCLLASMMEV